MTSNRFIDLHDCAVSGEIPQEIRTLIARCESGEEAFDNDDMSLALKFGEMVWRRLLQLAEHYERQAESFMPGDSRIQSTKQAAKDMRFVLSDTAVDL